MGIDDGFDMDSPLNEGVLDRQNWDSFIDSVKTYYKDDKQVEMRHNYISFNAGEHPRLPFEGYKFLRFSSKISGHIAKSSGVEEYIKNVTNLAKNYFGSRIIYWDESQDQNGVYGWDKVHESIESYEQKDDRETFPSVFHPHINTVSFKEVKIPLFEIIDIPGKGRGMVARTKGTRILCEKPLLRVQARPPEKLEVVLAEKLRAMFKTLQRQFLILHNNFPGKYPFSGTVRTNALPCGPGSDRKLVASTLRYALSTTVVHQTPTTVGTPLRNEKPFTRSNI